MIKIENKEQFELEIKKEGTVVVDFYADWCGPCKMLAAVLEDISDDIDFELLKVNTDEQKDLAREFAVSSIPYLVLYKNGEKIAEQVGFPGEEKLVEFISQ